MCKFRRHYFTVSREDYEQVDTILEEYYCRGDIENIGIETDIVNCSVTIGLECSTDDLEALKGTLKQKGIIVV